VPLNWWVGKSQEHVAPAGHRLGHKEPVSLVTARHVEDVAIELSLQKLHGIEALATLSVRAIARPQRQPNTAWSCPFFRCSDRQPCVAPTGSAARERPESQPPDPRLWEWIGLLPPAADHNSASDLLDLLSQAATPGASPAAPGAYFPATRSEGIRVKGLLLSAHQLSLHLTYQREL
jgi:hypothetical protein